MNGYSQNPLVERFTNDLQVTANKLLSEVTTQEERQLVIDTFKRNEQDILNRLMHEQHKNNGNIHPQRISDEIRGLVNFTVKEITTKRNMMNNYNSPQGMNNFSMGHGMGMNNMGYNSGMQSGFSSGMVSNNQMAMNYSYGDPINNQKHFNPQSVIENTIKTSFNNSIAEKINTAPNTNQIFDVKSTFKKENPFLNNRVNINGGGLQFKEQYTNKTNTLEYYGTFKDADDVQVKVCSIKTHLSFNDFFEAKKSIYHYNPFAILNTRAINILSYREYLFINSGFTESTQELKKFMTPEISNTYEDCIAILGKLSHDFVQLFKNFLTNSINDMLSLYGVVDDNYPDTIIKISELSDLQEILTNEDGTFKLFLEHPRFESIIRQIYKSAFKSIFDASDGAKFFIKDADVGHFIRCNQVFAQSKNSAIDKVEMWGTSEASQQEIFQKFTEVTLFSKRKYVIHVNHFEENFLQQKDVWVVEEDYCNLHYVCKNFLKEVKDADLIFEIDGKPELALKVGLTLNGNLIFRR